MLKDNKLNKYLCVWVMLLLSIVMSANTVYTYDTISVCEHDIPYKWNKKQLMMPGTYADTLPKSDGGDSVVFLVFNLIAPLTKVEEVTIKEGESYFWHGKTYSEGGYYYDTIFSEGLCGTAYQLILKKNTTAADLAYCLEQVDEAPILDYSDLNAAFIRCGYGDYMHPIQAKGIVSEQNLQTAAFYKSHQFFDGNSRESDPIVTSLCVVPSQGVPSIRLGTGAEGKSGQPNAFGIDIQYTPTGDADGIAIQYASVMQTAIIWHDHMRGNKVQPCYFSFVILDANGDTIPGSYLYCDEEKSNFWIKYEGVYRNAFSTKPQYHPWDKYIVDLSNYKNQQLTIRAISSRCSTFACFSMLYFALTPASLSASCCDVCGVMLSAPKDKSYKWHKGEANAAVISTMNAIGVPADGTMYYCDITDPNTGTTITLHHEAYSRIPVAKFDYTYDICTSEYHFSDSSYISKDGAEPLTPFQFPESCEWDFGNGQTYVGHTPPSIIYEDNADYVVTLVAKSTGSCTDTLRVPIHVAKRPPHYNYERIDTICSNDTLFVGDDYEHILPGEYIDTLQTVVYGCDSIIHIYLYHWAAYIPIATSEVGAEHLETISQDTPSGVVRPGEQWKDPIAPVYIQYDTICHGEEYWWRGHVYNRGGTFGDTLTTIHGCDSIFMLKLYAYPSYIHTPLGPIEAEHLTPIPQTTPVGIVRPGVQWKDPLAADYMYHDTICKGDTLEWHGKKLFEEKIYVDSLKTIHGCDSLFYMDLHLKYCGCDTAYSTIYKQIDEKELPFEWNNLKVPTIPQNERQDTTLVFPTIKVDESCDSIATLHLHVLFPCELPATYLPVYYKKEE